MRTTEEVEAKISEYEMAIDITSDHIYHHRNADGENEEFLRWLEGKVDILKWVIGHKDIRYVEKYPNLKVVK